MQSVIWTSGGKVMHADRMIFWLTRYLTALTVTFEFISLWPISTARFPSTVTRIVSG